MREDFFFNLQILGLIIVLVTAIPKPEEEHGHRILNKDLSDEEHFINSHHNPAYDHEAFLGEDAKTFNQLTPEESTRRLSIIVDRIDKDQDGYVTKEELKDWILYTQKRYVRDDVERQWEAYNPSNKEKFSWAEYKNMTYSDLDENDPPNPGNPEDGSYSYKIMLKRDLRRWSFADVDGDDMLTKEEFTGFLHADQVEHMKDVVALETFEDIDKDADGKISVTEYIGDMSYHGDEGDEDPEWVKNEKEQFFSFRDKDKDGFMDLKEVKEWIVPADYDHAEAESRHLIYEADIDADQKLTKDEILEKYDIFVGSQATDFGAALTRHDEF